MTEELEVIGFAFEGRDMNEELDEVNQHIAELQAELAALREAAQEMSDAMGRGEDRELAALGKLEAALQEKGE